MIVRPNPVAGKAAEHLVCRHVVCYQPEGWGGVHRIAALLKRWLLSTHQGSVSPKHLEYYLDEYTFRFNRR